MTKQRPNPIPRWTLAAALACITALVQAQTVNAGWLKSQHIGITGALLDARRTADQAGEHVLVLTRAAGPSPSAPDSGRIEHIELLATYYGRTNTGWKPAWTIRDQVDCPGLDVTADFARTGTTVTDLNTDGRNEITVAYRMSCAGGIEPATVKVILRDGERKLAIRGESLIRLPGQAPFGGAHRHDSALLRPENAAFKRHLDKVWEAVSKDTRG